MKKYLKILSPISSFMNTQEELEVKFFGKNVRKINVNIFFLKGMYFNDKFALIDNNQFKSPFYENSSDTIDDEKDYELFSSKIKQSLDHMAPYEKYKKIKKKKNFLYSKIKKHI